MDQEMNSSSMPNMSPPNSMDMATMHMTFYWSKNAIVLFSGWPGSSLGMYILSLFFIFLLALVVEVLSVASTTSIKIAAVNPLLRALVHALRMGLAYMIMLAIMSFNLGIFIAAVIGHGVGFFVVRARAGGDGNSPDSVPKV